MLVQDRSLEISYDASQYRFVDSSLHGLDRSNYFQHSPGPSARKVSYPQSGRAIESGYAGAQAREGLGEAQQ